MADLLCVDDWNSEIGGRDNGTFTLKLTPNGQITGEHIDQNGERCLVWGTCQHSFFEGHKIDLFEPRIDPTTKRPYAFRYFAKITPKDDGKHKTKDGKRRKIEPPSGDVKEVADPDDDWVGTHGT